MRSTNIKNFSSLFTQGWDDSITISLYERTHDKTKNKIALRWWRVGFEDYTRSLLNCRWKKRHISIALSKLMKGILLWSFSGELWNTHTRWTKHFNKKQQNQCSILIIKVSQRSRYADHQGVLIIKVSLCTKGNYGTSTKCLDYVVYSTVHINSMHYCNNNFTKTTKNMFILIWCTILATTW